MDSFLSTMFENHCLQAWGDVLRESFAWSIAYSIFWSRMGTCSSSLCGRLWISFTLNHCTESKRAVLCICLLNKWTCGRGHILYIEPKEQTLKVFRIILRVLTIHLLSIFGVFVLIFFVVCLKKTSMEIARLSSCWLSQKFFYITCGVNKFTTLIAAFSTVVCLLL